MVHAPDAACVPARCQRGAAVPRSGRQLQVQRRPGIRRLSRTRDRSVPCGQGDREAGDRQLRLRDPVRLLHPSQGPMSSNNSFFGIPALLESGLVMAQSAMKTAQRRIDDLTGHSYEIKGAPVEGPEDIDLAVADFANRMSRFARYSYDPLDLSRLATASGEIVSAAKASFRNFSLTDPRNVALPVQVALSLGSLMAESALRGLVTFDVVGPARMPRLVSDFFEVFTETPVF